MSQTFKLLGICLVFFIVYSAYAIWNFSLFHTDALVAEVDQVVWKYSHMQIPITTLGSYPFASVLSYHTEFFLALLSIFYRIYQSPITLFVSQGLIVSFGAYMVALWIKNKTKNDDIAIVVMVCFLGFFGLQQLMSVHIYSLDLGIAWVMGFIYFLDRRQIPFSIILLILALSTREEIGIITGCIALVYYFSRKDKLALVTALVSLLFVGLIFLVYFPQITHTKYDQSIYADVLNSFKPKQTFKPFSVNTKEAQEHADMIQSVLSQLPPDVPLAGSDNILSHISQRAQVYQLYMTHKQLPICSGGQCVWIGWLGSPSYIIIDTSQAIGSSSKEEMLEALSLMESANYLKIYLKKGDIRVYIPDPKILGDGLLAEYYPNQILFGDPSVSRVDPQIHFRWTDATNFSVRWSGFIKSEFSEEYTFYARRDDGIRVWINGELIINKWFDHAEREYTGIALLPAGQKVPIVVEYYQNQGVAIADLSWSSASTPKEIIPQTALYSY